MNCPIISPSTGQLRPDKNRWSHRKRIDLFRLSSLSLSLLLKSSLLSKSRSHQCHELTYPSSFMSRCSPHPRPSRTRQSEIFKPNISCLSMLITRVKGSPIFTFSATWCCVGSPLKIFIVHPGIGAVAYGQFKYFMTIHLLLHFKLLRLIRMPLYEWYMYRWITRTNQLCRYANTVCK